MQKVEGSNPFSRFQESPAPVGLSASWGPKGRVGAGPDLVALCPSVPEKQVYRPISIGLALPPLVVGSQAKVA